MTRITPNLKQLIALSGRYHAENQAIPDSHHLWWLIATDIQHPVFSPDGTSILFTLGGFELYTMNLSDHEVKRIAASTRLYREKAFSPDGREIAFIRDQAGYGVSDELWIMRSDGTQARQISLEL